MSQIMDSVDPRSDLTPASVPDEIQMSEERLEILLLESITIITKLRAAVTELQVECVQQEEIFSQMYNPKLVEEAREILDNDISDPFEELDEMDNTN